MKHLKLFENDDIDPWDHVVRELEKDRKQEILLKVVQNGLSQNKKEIIDLAIKRGFDIESNKDQLIRFCYDNDYIDSIKLIDEEAYDKIKYFTSVKPYSQRSKNLNHSVGLIRIPYMLKFQELAELFMYVYDKETIIKYLKDPTYHHFNEPHSIQNTHFNIVGDAFGDWIFKDVLKINPDRYSEQHGIIFLYEEYHLQDKNMKKAVNYIGSKIYPGKYLGEK